MFWNQTATLCAKYRGDCGGGSGTVKKGTTTKVDVWPATDVDDPEGGNQTATPPSEIPFPQGK